MGIIKRVLARRRYNKVIDGVCMAYNHYPTCICGAKR